MTRIYTKTGDKGETSLGDGSRALKSSARINLYGEVDELNSVLGHAVAVLHRTGDHDNSDDPALLASVKAELIQIQSYLFDLGAILANPTQSKTVADLPVVDQPFSSKKLELSMDQLDKSLDPLRTFILPGGCEVAGILHVARCVCRRTERSAVALALNDDVPSGAIIYLNRLSDFFFTAARAVNAATGISDVPWVDKGAPTASDAKEGDEA